MKANANCRVKVKTVTIKNPLSLDGSDLGLLIRDMRIHVGFTQVELGERLGVSQSRISQMENGDVGTEHSLFRVAEACGFSTHLSFVR
jgi:DNA-binding XRE family transcriptional regulator